MKIPGLDDALKKLDKFDEMQPVLEEIRDSLNVLVQLQTLSLKRECNIIMNFDVEQELDRMGL